MAIENVIAMIICVVAALCYAWCAIRAEKSRLYHQKQGDKATEVLDQLTKLWGSSAKVSKTVAKCEKCHENTAMATVNHKLLCKSCYKEAQDEEI